MKIEHRRIDGDYDTDAFAARMPERLRDDLVRDLPEGRAAAGGMLRRMIRGALESGGEAWTVAFDGADVALYGVKPDKANQAFVVVVEAEGYDAGCRVPFMRAVARRMEEWGRRYKMLYGIIHKDFPEFIRFMEYIGFISDTFAEDERYVLVVKTWE
jgi:hypothetical protein